MDTEQSLDFWVKNIAEIYHDQHSKREATDMLLPVVQYASFIAEDVRKAEYGELHSHLAHTFAWFCALVGRCKFFPANTHPFYQIEDNLSDLIGYKYPNKCGHCASNPCDCAKRRMQLEFAQDKVPSDSALVTARKQFKRTYQNWTLQNWVSMFDEIYSNLIYAMSVESIAFHLMEELGEVARALRGLIEYEGALGKESELDSNRKKDLDYKKYSFQTELADVFSWLIAVYLKLGHIEKGLGIKQKDLSEDLWSLYGIPQEDKLFCAKCRTNPCKCVFYFREHQLNMHSRAVQ